jgi:hypothetical protein
VLGGSSRRFIGRPNLETSEFIYILETARDERITICFFNSTSTFGPWT